MPARIPALASSVRTVANASASSMMYAVLTRDRSQIGGTKSSPMPSTSHEPAMPTVPVAT